MHHPPGPMTSSQAFSVKLSSCACLLPTILDKINGKPRPPPSPQIKDGKMARFYPSRGFILDLGGGGTYLTYLDIT